ncbi:tetratricopeptide repeat protein [Chondrinema litorale]|uniref:tetratricopeptide repeat protein n=1 Tax=Chondrinema litorale TaxID=2994555 RepID=UPI002542C53D|nr:tetratricopeptide repeat protein [Chondrinema litorale]UZR94693.1 tetratricopeptide repeat protein [Chondrinema litorale]
MKYLISYWLLLCLNIALVNAQSDPYTTAQNLIQNNRFEEAIILLDEALNKSPNNPEIFFTKANCYINLGKFKEATEILEKSVEIKKDFTKSYEMLGDLYTQFRMADKAVANYELAFETDPNQENRLKYKMDIINILNIVKQQQDILPHIEEAKKISSDNFDVQFLEAEYYNYIGDFNKAKEMLDKIIPSVPNVPGNEKYFYEAGYAYHHLEQFKKADEFFAKITDGEYKPKLFQFSADYYFNLAETYYHVYEYHESEKHLNTLLKIDPTYTSAFDLQAKLTAVKTNKSEMIKVMEAAIEAIEKDGNSAPLEKIYELAILEYQNGQYEYAIESCNKILNINPAEYSVIFLKGACENQLKQSGEASATLERAVKNPKLPAEIKAKYYFLLGLIYKKAEELDQAEESFKNSMKGFFKASSIHELEMVFKQKQKLSAKK